MRWFYELAWLWKGLGISLLAAPQPVWCVWLVCRAAGKRLRTGIAVLAAAFAAAVVVILLLAQTQPRFKEPSVARKRGRQRNMPSGKQSSRPNKENRYNRGGNILTDAPPCYTF